MLSMCCHTLVFGPGFGGPEHPGSLVLSVDTYVADELIPYSNGSGASGVAPEEAENILGKAVV